jgi:hypothetical protein
MTRTLAPITAAEYTRAVGRAPILDDLQRANCTLAGTPGHWGCGWCDHGQPTYRCETCMRRVMQAATQAATHG